MSEAAAGGAPESPTGGGLATRRAAPRRYADWWRRSRPEHARKCRQIQQEMPLSGSAKRLKAIIWELFICKSGVTPVASSVG